MGLTVAAILETISDEKALALFETIALAQPNGSAHYYQYLPIAEKAIGSLKIRK